MLKEYQITNFKAFAGPANIPIKPITLIFGPNSSGKSAILQSMLMLKQTIEESRDPGIALLPKGNMVDLGSFREFIYRHDVDRSFSLKMNFSTPLAISNLGYRSDEMFFPNNDTSTLEESIDSDTIGVGVTFSLDKKTFNILVSKINLYIGDDPKPIVTYEGRTGSHYYFEGNFNHKYWATYWKHFDKENTEGLEELLNKHIERAQPYNITDTVSEILNRCSFKKKVAFLIEERKSNIGLLSKAMRQDPASEKAVQKLIGKINKCAEKDVSLEKKEHNKALQLEKMIQDTTVTDKMTDFEWAIEAYKCLFEEDSLDIIKGFLPGVFNRLDPKLIMEHDTYDKERRHVSLFALAAADLIENFLRDIRYIAPVREYPERIYIYGGNPLQFVGASGKMVFDVLFNNPELINSVNKEFERIGVNYELKLSPLSKEGTEINEAFSPHLFDKSTGVPVSFRDVGFGFSQVLPIIVQSMLSKNTTLLIEQPELHLHPALQAELGDLFIKSALGENKNTLIIETHSEHLILRIMRRMRETAEGNLKEGPPVSPKDVCILYIDKPKDKKSSVVYEMRLDRDGTLLDPWPGGFFEEGFKERFL